MNRKQKGLRTKFGMASNEFRQLEFSLNYIPKRYKRIRRMIKHDMDKLQKKIKDTEKKIHILENDESTIRLR